MGNINDIGPGTGRTFCSVETDWLSKAQLGAFMHYLPDGEQFKAIPQFDVDGLAEQLQWAGAAYL